MIAGFAAMLGQQARGKYLPSPQPNQRPGITDAQRPDCTRSSTSRRLNSCSLIDTTVWRISRDPRTGGSVTSTLHRGVICILRLQQNAAEHILC
jgi:hypothetical protein